MRGMKACGKCEGGDCKGGRNCMKEDKEEKKGTIEIKIALPTRGSRTTKNKAKKK